MYFLSINNLKEITSDPMFLTFVSVYLSFFLDNVLLTVIVPIIPDYLFHNHLNITPKGEITSLSPLQRKFEDLERDNGPLGALLASKAFVQLLCTPFVGYATAIYGYQRPLLFGNINMFFATLLFAFGTNYWSLVIARALHGSSSAGIAVSGMSLLADTLPPTIRGRIMPLAFGGIALGVLIGYPLGGAAYELLGKTAPFLLIAFLIFTNIFLQMYNLNNTTTTHLFKNQSEESIDWMCTSLLKNKQTLLTTGAICVCTATMAILEPCVPMWLMASITPPPTKWQLGAVFIPDSIGYFLGSHFTGFLAILPWRIALGAMLMTGLSSCAIPLATSIRDLTFPHFFLGLGVGALDAALVPLLATFVDLKSNLYAHAHYGPVYALQQAAVCLAYAIGPLVGGAVVQQIGFPWLIRIVGLLNVLYCPLLIELDHDPQENNKMALHDSLPSYSTLENSSCSIDGNELKNDKN